MSNWKITPFFLIQFTIVIGIFPRFFTPYAFELSTVSIILFWIAPLVLLPEYIIGYKSNKLAINQYSKFTIIFLVFCSFISLCSFFSREILWGNEPNTIIDFVRRSLYILHPAMLLSWYPMIKEKKQKEFLKNFILLSAFYLSTIGSNLITNSTLLEPTLVKMTAEHSRFILNLFFEDQVFVMNDIFYNESFSIKVTTVCSADITGLGVIVKNFEIPNCSRGILQS